MEPQAIHAILTAEAGRISLPKFYTRDLTFHDLNDLVDSKTQHFIYVLRECGTHIIRLDQGRQQYACVKAIAGFSDPDMHWYEFSAERFTPTQLLEISPEDAFRLATRHGR